MKTLQKIFFISNWAASGFRSGGILFTLAGAGLPVAAGAGAIVLMKKWRLNLTDRVEKTSRKKQRSTPDAVATVPLSEPGSPGKALLKREWSIICSNSSFLMEVIGEVAVLPILLLVFFFTIPEDYFSMFREMLGTITFTPLIALAALIFFSSINSVSSTSLSREGATFSLSKALPASGRQQVKAKMFLHLLLFLPAWYLNMIIMMTILGLSPINLIYLIPAGPAAIILGFISNIHIDLSRPVLTWNHPQQAMKQNMNVPIGMGFSILTAGGLSVIGLLVYFAGAGIIPAGIIAAAAAAAADFILLPKLMNYADRRYGEISP
jgi:ABC-2 type transport system permease protein